MLEGTDDPQGGIRAQRQVHGRLRQVSCAAAVHARTAHFRVHGQSKTGIINRRQFDEGYEVARRHADGFSGVLWRHRVSVEKIVLAYRLLRLIGK